MKIAYFDCFAGISGDMILGSLIDAGLDFTELQSELKKLNLPGYRLDSKPTTRLGITGTKVDVEILDSDSERHLKDIVDIIDQSAINDRIKTKSKEIFKRLASVEAKIHQKKINEVHFHEVGGIDAIIDIVGSVIGMEMMEIETVFSSKIHVGTGFTHCAHGKIPLPAPATLELLKGIPIFSDDIDAELTTPTGAAIISTLAKRFGKMPEMIVESIGYGAGYRNLNIPNLLRVTIGETTESNYETDEILQIETNIDNLNPELFEHIMERLFEIGALDVFLTPIFMKKTRPATMLTVLTSSNILHKVLTVIFDETTTLGVRFQNLKRKKLSREIMTVTTKYGKINVKTGKLGKQIITVSPEHEDAKIIALNQKVPLRDVYDEVKHVVREIYKK